MGSAAQLPPPNPRSSRRKEAPSEVRTEKDEGRTELHVIAPATSDDAVHDPSDLNQTASQSLLTSAATNQETQPAWFAESHSGHAPIFNVECGLPKPSRFLRDWMPARALAELGVGCWVLGVGVPLWNNGGNSTGWR